MNSPENDPLKTRPTLIDRIRNLDNNEAWTEFVRIYRPLIIRYCISPRWKMSPEDAEDIAQKTLTWVADRIKDFEYRPKDCPFRAWLLQKVHHLNCDRYRELNRMSGKLTTETDNHGQAPQLPLEQLPDPKSLEWDERWEEEHRRAILEAASQIVRRRLPYKYFQAFDMKAQGLSAKKIAQKLGETSAWVDVAVCRFKAELKTVFARLQKDYD
jgi:RNA polymerase sigma-70 factor, ECF subfamily